MTKDDSTWLRICYVVASLLVCYVAIQAVESFAVQLDLKERYDEWLDFIQIAFGVVSGGLALYWLGYSSKERYDYHLSAVAEVRKVNWPSAEDTKRMTIIVAVVVAVFAVILGVFDSVWTKCLQLILP